MVQLKIIFSHLPNTSDKDIMGAMSSNEAANARHIHTA